MRVIVAVILCSIAPITSSLSAFAIRPLVSQKIEMQPCIFPYIPPSPSFKNMRLVLTAALTKEHYDFREKQYLETLSLVQSYGYKKGYGFHPLYIVEALRKSPTFFEEYSDHVFYATVNNSGVKNQGINEAKTLLEAINYFNFDPDDMIVKLTGRHQLLSDQLLLLIAEHPTYDVFVKHINANAVWTVCFAMRCRYLQEMLRDMNYQLLETTWTLEYAVGDYLLRKKRSGLHVYAVDKLDVKANIFGSATFPGAPEKILYF